MVFVFKTPSPKAGRSVRFASSPTKSDRRPLGSTNLKSTVGQYSCTKHTNTVMVARLAPPVPGSTVKIYPPSSTSDHWADLPKAVNNLSLTAINFPRLLDSPATDSNTTLKNKNISKNTMKNIFPPSRAPRATRSTSKGVDPVAFDDNVDIPAALGASPVPDDTPTHPTLYKGSLAFGSPHRSKLSRALHLPSTYTSPDDDQKQPAKKKRRTSAKQSRNAYFDVHVFDDFDEIIRQNRNLYPHSAPERNMKLPEKHAAPINQDTTKTSPLATTKTAKMQTTTTTTTKDETTTKSGTTTDLDGPDITHYAPTNDTYKTIGTTGDNEEEELPITAATCRNHPEPCTEIHTADQQNDLRTPPKALLSPPSKAYKHRLDTPRISGLNPSPLSHSTIATNLALECQHSTMLTPLQRTSQQLLNSFNDAFLMLTSPTTLNLIKAFQHTTSEEHARHQHFPDCSTQPAPAINSRYYPLLESETLLLTHHLGTLHQHSTDIDITCTSNHVHSLQNGVTAALNTSHDEQLMSLQEILFLVSHVLRRAKTYHRTREKCTINLLSEDEPNPTDGSRDMTAQSFASPPSTLVACSDPADSCAKTMTWPDVEDSPMPQNFDADLITIAPKTPDSAKISQVSTPLCSDYDPVYSPCYLEESDPSPNFPVNSMKTIPNRQNSKSSSIQVAILGNDDFVQRLFNGSDASDPYCAAVDTATVPTVVQSAPSCPSPPQWAYRAHNETDPTASLTSLSIQHPVPIKLEDFPMSPAAEDAMNGEYCYSTSNNAPSNAPVNFYPVVDPEILPGPELEPEPMMIERIEDKLIENVEANQVFEAPEEPPTDAIQQPVRMLPPLFPEPPLRHPNPLDPVHQHPFRMFQDPLHHPPPELYFSEGILDDPTNGSIHLHDLPLCVKLSNTITAFCLTFLAAPPEVNHIRDITLVYMKHTSLYITRLHYHPGFDALQLPRDHIQYVRSMRYTLNRATNLLHQHFNDEQRSLLTLGTPTRFYDLTPDFYLDDEPPCHPMETQCAAGLIYALRLYYLTHHRHTNNGNFRGRELYPKHLYEITREIKSTAAALSLFPARTTFRTMPRFANFAFFEADLFPLSPDGFLNHRSVAYYRRYALAEFNRTTPYIAAYANSFRLTNAEHRSFALRTAQDIVRLAIFEHHLLARMTKKRSRQPELRNNRVHIGNLPPADLYISSFATCFPMITKPSIVQLDLDDVNDDTLAINFVVCKPLDYHHLISSHQKTATNSATWTSTPT
jgi:hypothetical protein